MEHRCAPSVLINIRLGQKGLPGANALAYLHTASVTKKKVFYNNDTWPRAGHNVIKLFTAVIFLISWSVCPLQALPNVMFVGKARNLLKIGAP